ncbi:MAG: proton-conducting transporter membrane subunit, partial [Nitrososphaera sp.]
MAESYFLLAATFMPLLLAPIAYLIGKRSGSTAVTWFSFGTLAISTGLLFIPTMLLHGGMSSYEESYVWGQFGNFGLRLDGLALPFALIIYILCTVLALYSKPYMIHKIMEQMPGASASQGGHEHHGSTGQVTLTAEQQKYVNHQMGLYFGLYLAFSMGMLGSILATNLIEFYVFFELMLVPSFFLIAFYGYGAKRRIALMFFFWTHVGAVVLLLSLLAMGFFAGGFDYATVKE